MILLIFRKPKTLNIRVKMSTTPSDLAHYWETKITPQSVVSFYLPQPRSKNPLGIFSNFQKHKSFKFILPKWAGICAGDKVMINFTEKAIMLIKASLMGDKYHYSLIKESSNPGDVKRLGRKVTNFNEEIWQQNVCRIAKYVVAVKFKSVFGYDNILLETGSAIIAEAAKNDFRWGIGMNSTNSNINIPAKWIYYDKRKKNIINPKIF